MIKDNIIKFGFAVSFTIATAVSMLAITTTTSAQEQVTVEDLVLTSVCSANPDVSRKWRVQNVNDFAVDFRYEVVGTSQEGNLTAPAAGDGVIKFPGASDGADYTFFETDAVGGANTTNIFWDNGIQEASTNKASGGAVCDSFFEFDKVWNGDDVDTNDVTVVFNADDEFSWTLGDEPVQVEPGETTLTNVTEVVTGLPEGCSYTSSVPAEIMAPNTGYNDVTNVFTLTVTNTVSCDDEEEEQGEVLADVTEDEKAPQVTITPVGPADAGRSVDTTAMIGMIGSVVALVAGFAARKFVRN